MYRKATLVILIFYLVACASDNSPSLDNSTNAICSKAWTVYYEIIRKDIAEFDVTLDRFETKNFSSLALLDSTRFILVVDTSRHTTLMTNDSLVLQYLDSVYIGYERTWINEPRTLKELELENCCSKLSKEIRKAWSQLITADSKKVLVEISLPIQSENAYYISLSLLSRESPNFIRYTVILDSKNLNLLAYIKQNDLLLGKNDLYHKLSPALINQLDQRWAPYNRIDSLSRNYDGLNLDLSDF